MARIADHIQSVDNVNPVSGLSVPDAPAVEAVPRDGGVVPWLWIAAWMLGWGILVAYAAYWVGAEGVRGRDIWIWLLIWLAGGLAVAALAVRMAAQDTERAYTLRRLSSARQEIAKLEAQLQTSTRSLFSATQTLTEATELLLEQVDTSRDDLRNQIRSAHALADSLRTQTEGLVSARSEYVETLRSEIAPTPQDTPDPSVASIIAVRPVASEVDDASDGSPDVGEKMPPLGLRPAPDAEDTFLGPELSVAEPTVPETIVPEADASPAPVDAIRERASGDWEWKDMLSSVDAATPHSDDGHAVIASLKAAGLAPDTLVDEGNAMDALDMWAKAGLPAMGQLLSIRFDEPARLYRETMREDAELESKVVQFSKTRASRLATASRAGREADAATETGRAWLFVQAVLAL